MHTQTPKLRFPEFSDKWEMKKFGEIFTFRTTNSFSRDNLNYEFGSVRNIHYGDIHTKFKTQFNLKNELVPFVNEEINIDKIPADNYCKVGDLVIADASEDYADIGKCIEIRNLNNEKTIAGLHTFLARPDLFEMSLGFNGYIMQSRNIRLQIMTIAQGTKVLSLSTGRLANVELNIPQLPEQTKIANFLTAIDEKIQALKQKKTLLEQYKKGIMQQIFSQELRFKNDDGSDFDDWEEKSLGEISNIKRGASPRPISDKRWFSNISNIGWVRISDVTKSNKFLNKTEQYLSDEGVKKSRFLEKGNLIMSICATIGKPIYTNIPVCIHDGFVVFDDIQADREYVYYYLDFIQDKWYQYGQPGSQVNLNTEIVSNEIINFPSISEQQKIASFLTAIDEKIEKVSQQITAIETYKKGLLQQMFI